MGAKTKNKSVANPKDAAVVRLPEPLFSRSSLIRAFAAVACVTAILLLAGCSGGRAHTESRSVALGEARSVTATIDARGADLEVAGEAKGLMEADFSYRALGLTNYDASGWEPKVDYRMSGGRGEASVEIPKVGGVTGWLRHRADIKLNDQVPLELRVNQGGGQVSLDLGSLDLRRLDVDTGGGDLELDLSGTAARDLEASIRSGNGVATLRLPEDAGVRVATDGGVVRADGFENEGDAFFNDAYGGPEPQLRINVSGEGDVRLEETG